MIIVVHKARDKKKTREEVPRVWILGKKNMDFRLMFKLFLVSLLGEILVVEGLACNWGTRATHPLPPDIAVKLMRDNGINKVKLFEIVPEVMKALGKSGIEVMVGIPNDLLAPLASSVRAAEDWVSKNVSTYVSRNGVNVRYVAIGNEPFLKTYKDMFTKTIYPALENIQAALIKAGLGRQVKVTIPINADVYQSESGLPSGGNFRPDIRDLMISIIKFLNDNGGPLTINIYPFLSLYADPHFPVDFAFFDGTPKPVVDGGVTYNNVFEANYDTLIWALEKIGFPDMPVIVGEVGWPTDGDKNANIEYARRFNQGLLNRINQGKGTPKRQSPPDTYLFALIDEDAKSIEPGNFERHWGIFYYDGSIKYPLNLGTNRNLTAAKGVRYLSRQWCTMRPDADPSDPNLPQSLNKACTYADCTSLGYGSSCGGLDVRNNASYAFNMYFQTMNQQKGSCDQFNNLSVITAIDPGTSIRNSSCRFEIMIDTGRHEQSGTSSAARRMYSWVLTASFLLGLLAFVC